MSESPSGPADDEPGVRLDRMTEEERKAWYLDRAYAEREAQGLPRDVDVDDPRLARTARLLRGSFPAAQAKGEQ